ncbi:MAG: S-adenosyl-methyltransferase MraW [Candidatus Magasanikbacteria bacterium]|nr:S-adenosyl-methyltransferase MraW [Candidatus Magasanikbacteria bacterium]
MPGRHVPVLMAEVLSALNLGPNKNVIDLTVGDGGHTEKILEATAPRGRVLALDADPESLVRAKTFLYPWRERVIFMRENFRELARVIKENKFSPANGALLDLGWSTPQMEERGRGLSFLRDEPLDMRFNPAQELTAEKIVNEWSYEELTRIFRLYGEERAASAIAEAIVSERRVRPITRTTQLTDLIASVFHGRRGKIHPATRVFQALRIAVNDELTALRETLPQMVAALVSGGRAVVISFHSLEDRIVKQFMAKEKSIKIITAKPIMANAEEIALNPRSRSAKLRVLEKI